ncbi:hypothetical protein SASPL_111896 [Salvia splendens]|uniref:Uncharacterized protein n=1 Tax=Salvia splendens TaxID=180675 RepID=A0A8X8Y773_SALSN|nr:hypothetical protein SASPL_111896 [Salvia splendens]
MDNRTKLEEVILDYSFRGGVYFIYLHNTVALMAVLDAIMGSSFAAVLLFFLLVFTPLGDSLAASGRQTLLRSDPRHRGRLVALVEQGRQAVAIDACPTDMVDHMPSEDPRINSQLSLSL